MVDDPRRGAARHWLAAAMMVACLVGAARGGEYRVDWRQALDEWRFPAGMVTLDQETGTIRLARYRGRYNAVSDAPSFTHTLVDKSERAGGVHADKVGSNPATGSRVADGGHDTYWQPAANDALEDWWFEVDLGRATLVTDIRLVFPDRPGARPFREFTLFGSEGRRTGSRGDVHFFRILGSTTRPNADSVVVFDVQPAVAELVRSLPDPTRADLDELEKSYDVLQYIRFVADRQTAEAALAEIEVYTPGENIALRTLERLGSVVDVNQPGAKPEPGQMADGTMNDMWGTAFASAAWEWDLGGLFWIRQIVMRASAWEQRVRWYADLLVQIMPHALRVSDGSETLTGEIDYELLFDTERDAFGPTQSEMPMQVDYRFAPRRVRYIKGDWEGSSKTGWIGETIIIPAGQAAEVMMVSDLIDLRRESGGTNAKVIEALSWDTEAMPDGTYIRARSRSGVTVVDSTIYYHKDGREITEELWRRLEGVNQHGPTVTYQVPGPDWSGWSNWYTEPETEFLSPSPRRYVQLMLVLGSERHNATPVIRALSLRHSDAVLTDITGQVQPREVAPDADSLFTYTLAPQSLSSTERFNHILIKTPSPATTRDVSLWIEGVEQLPTDIDVTVRAPDSLVVGHRLLRNESVAVTFRSRVVGNATLIPALVGYSDGPQLPALWQPVNAAGTYATTVLVPDVARSSGLISGLRVTPVVTPNGDGVGDEATVRFVVLRSELLSAAQEAGLAQVRIRDLAGRLVAQLQPRPSFGQDLTFVWSGVDVAGQRVPPGTYLCEVRIETESVNEVAARVIAVAY